MHYFDCDVWENDIHPCKTEPYPRARRTPAPKQSPKKQCMQAFPCMQAYTPILHACMHAVQYCMHAGIYTCMHLNTVSMNTLQYCTHACIYACKRANACMLMGASGVRGRFNSAAQMCMHKIDKGPWCCLHACSTKNIKRMHACMHACVFMYLEGACNGEDCSIDS